MPHLINVATDTRGLGADTHRLRLQERLIRSQKMNQSVRVRGYAREPLLWPVDEPTHCSGILEMDGVSVPFEARAESMPGAGDRIVFIGAIQVTRQFEIKLVGDIEGSWEPLGHFPFMRVQPRHRLRVTVRDQLERHSLQTLGLLTTEVARNEIFQASSCGELERCRWLAPDFSNVRSFLVALDRLSVDGGLSGLVIACGAMELPSVAGDSPMVLQELMMLDMPFYVALGRPEGDLMLDRYADESFVLPSDLGHHFKLASHSPADQQITACKHVEMHGLVG